MKSSSPLPHSGTGVSPVPVPRAVEHPRAGEHHISPDAAIVRHALLTGAAALSDPAVAAAYDRERSRWSRAIARRSLPPSRRAATGHRGL